jgi:hypothetical protein
MDSHRDWIRLEDIARLEGLPYKTVQKSLHRSRALSKRDEQDARRRVYSVTVLTPGARTKWLSEQASPAPQIPEATFQAPGVSHLNSPESISPSGLMAATDAGRTTPSAIAHLAASALASSAGADSLSQPLLPFAPPSPSDEARAKAVAAIPEREQKHVDKWLALLADHLNGTWKRYLGADYAGFAINKREDFLKAQARMECVSERSVYSKLALARDILKNASVPTERKWQEIAEAMRPKLRPGRSSAAFFVQEENAWMWPELRRIYLSQAQFSKEHTYRLFIELLRSKQRVHRLGHYYCQPTKWQVFTALEKIARPEKVLARQGDKAYDDKCSPYITRRAPEFSGDFVSTDQKYIDVLCRDHSWNLGRIWMVSFVDVASALWLGSAFGPCLSGDMVMDAAAMMLEVCKPRNVQMDLGKEFIGQRFTGGIFKLSGERFYSEAVGLWERLGVNVVKAIGRNPKTKPIERWHRSVRDFEQLWPTWTGSNTAERPEQLSEIEREVKDKVELFKQGRGDPPPVPTIEDVIRGFIFWAEQVWNQRARSRGQYRPGLTPREAWNVKRPEGGHRALSAAEIEYYTADRKFVKIARGGQINLWFHGQKIEYEAPELFMLQGLEEKVEVLISRRDLSQVTVIYGVPGGSRSCVARWKGESTWGEESRDSVKLRMRCIATVKRALKRGLKDTQNASELLGAAPYLPTSELLAQASSDKLIQARQAFGAEKQDSGSRIQDSAEKHGEIGSVEWAMRRHGRHQTSEEAADEVWKLMNGTKL